MSKRSRRREQFTDPAAIPSDSRSEYVQSLTVRLPDFAEPKATPIPLTEFSAPEFSIEPVKGARSFNVDKLGRLRGVTYDQIWTPGENESKCRADESSQMMVNLQSIYGSLFGTYGAVAPATYQVNTPKKSTDGPHSLPGCKCGFYGYYDGSNDYHDKERVSAVVEGYGEVVIGTRGFRATKARIIALTIPDTVTLAARIRHNYRDIPIYDTFAEMVAAHPTDTVAGPTPESDPDFWTRSAT